MRQITILLFALAATALGQTGRITGTVVDDAGAAISGASVTAALWSTPQPIQLVPGKPPAFMPVPANALTGSKGEFQIEGLLTGKYHVCVEKPEAAMLNPCLWADAPVRVDVTTGATFSGVSVVAAKGVTVNVRVQDAKGLLMANPALDDVRVGTFHRVSPFIPGQVSDRDPAGRTMSVIVPRGQAASISVSSASFALADEKGVPLASTEIPVSAAAVGNAAVAVGAATPAVTVQITGPKAK